MFRAGVDIKALLNDAAFMKAYQAWLSSEFTQRMLLISRRLALPTSPGPGVVEYGLQCTAALHESVGANGMLDFLSGLLELAVVAGEKDAEASYQLQSFLRDWGYKDEEPTTTGAAPSGSKQPPRKPSKVATRVSGRK